jgi:hypothetical protein
MHFLQVPLSVGVGKFHGMFLSQPQHVALVVHSYRHVYVYVHILVFSQSSCAVEGYIESSINPLATTERVF